MKLRTAVIFIGCVFLADLILIFTGVAKRFEYVDVPLHILGGVGWGMVAAMLILKAGKANHPKWFNFLFALGLVMTVGVLWEFAEFIFQHFLGPQTWRDTLGDLMNDGYGAIIAWYLFIRKLV